MAEHGDDKRSGDRWQSKRTLRGQGTDGRAGGRYEVMGLMAEQGDDKSLVD